MKVRRKQTSLVILLLYVLEELGMHGCDVHEEGLHCRVVGDGPTTTLVALHPVHEDLQLGAEGGHEFVQFFCFTVLVTLWM